MIGVKKEGFSAKNLGVSINKENPKRKAGLWWGVAWPPVRATMQWKKPRIMAQNNRDIGDNIIFEFFWHWAKNHKRKTISQWCDAQSWATPTVQWKNQAQRLENERDKQWQTLHEK